MTVAKNILVVGAGSWGTALASHLASGPWNAGLWGRSAVDLTTMSQTGKNERYLPGVPLHSQLKYVTHLSQGVEWADVILLVTPSKTFASMIEQMDLSSFQGKKLAWACKGFEPGTGRLLHDVARDLLGEHFPLAVATGPTFALEVAQGKPTALTIASQDATFREELIEAFHHHAFRAYSCNDVVGAELGGAVKNIMAIATGLADGMNLGLNAQAAIITRGLAEIMRLGKAVGAQLETMMGLAGLGDLVLTCTGDLSRNRRMGLALGQGKTIEQAQAEIGQIVEGVGNAGEVLRLAQQHQIEMPITKQVHAVVTGQKAPEDALRNLMSRESRPEA